MKRKTYNNVLKAGKLIQAKGYSEKESLEIAVQKFDELASLKNGMSVEWLIDRMATKTEREGESMKLSESDKSYFKKCGYLDQDIPQIEKAIEVMQYEDENDKKVSRKYVLDNMDRETWLSGIGRAAFHWSAARETKDGKTIFFDARKLFKDEFSVDILMYGNMVEIHRAIKNGQNLKADRTLKQFMQLALLMSCYKKFGYLK